MDQSALQRALAVASALAIILVMVLVSMRVWPEASSSGSDQPGPFLPRVVELAETSAPPREETTSSVAPTVATSPTVGGSTCEVRVYTPPTSVEPFEGDLCRPDVAQRDVAIVLVHGGGGVGGVRADFGQWQEWYLKQGYVTFNIDYRLLDPALDNGLFPRPEANVKAAVQYLRLIAEDVDVDPEHIVVHGASAGARLGGVAVVTPNEPSFGIDELWPLVGDEVNGFIGFYGYYNGWQFESDAYFGGPIDPLADAESHADGVSGPVFLVHGTGDGLISVELSQSFASALSSAGADVTLSFPEGENHIFDGYDGEALTPAGEIEAAKVLFWLEERFG